jgi:F-type H+-transporting ATPase subunit b
MPQLDITAFTPQIIWLIITFLLLYVLMAKLALPRIGNILEQRQARIDDHLDVAQNLKNEANIDAKSYEDILAEAREQAREAIQNTNKEITLETARHQEELNTRLSDELKSAEDRIEKAKASAIENIHESASIVTLSAVSLLIGEKPPENDLKRAVVNAIEESKKEHLDDF